MTRPESNTAAQNTGSSTWWTPRRMKLAGMCGLVGGIGGIAVPRLLISSIGLGLPGAVGILYPVWYVLFVVALLGTNARYGTNYGRSGRYVVALLALSLVSYAGSIILFAVSPTVFAGLTPIGFLAGMAYLAMRGLGSLYGISLWRHTDASRLTAGLFIVLFPAIFILGLLTQLGVPGVLVVATLHLAFIALGIDLWRTSTDTSVRAIEAIE